MGSHSLNSKIAKQWHNTHNLIPYFNWALLTGLDEKPKKKTL